MEEFVRLTKANPKGLEEIMELDYTCGKYFSNNRQHYCKRNITGYYLNLCDHIEYI